MDAMALLCNMHADGPATIRLLRRAGFSSLSDITRARHERLADLLGVSPAYARRFVREARLLGDRMGEIVFDREEAAEPDTKDASRAAEVAALNAGPPPPTFEREVLPPASRSAARANPLDPANALDEDRAQAERTAGARIVPTQGTPLRSAEIEGLGAVWCDRLVAQGILTLETLADAPGMKLAKRLGVPLTELMDLQLLAQRKITERASAASSIDVERALPVGEHPAERERDFVIYPPRRAIHAADFEDLEPRDEGRRSADEMDEEVLPAAHAARRQEPEDVGGPFA